MTRKTSRALDAALAALLPTDAKGQAMTTKKRAKRVVEAWYFNKKGEADKDFGQSGFLSFDPPTAYGKRTMDVRHLVESRPEDAAELKALRRVAKAAERYAYESMGNVSLARLERAVAALKKARGK